MVDLLQTGQFEAGRRLVGDLANERANIVAGRQMAAGQTDQASRTLYGVGNLQGGAAFGGMAQQQQAAASEQELQRRQQTIQFTRQATQAIRQGAQSGRNPVELFDSYVPVLRQLGTSEQDLTQYRQALEADPAGFLDGVDRVLGEQERELRILNTGSGGWRAIDQSTGQVVSGEDPFIRPVVVGRNLVNPQTGAVLYEGAPDVRYQEVEGPTGEPIILAIGQNGVSTVYQGATRQPDSQVLSDGEVQALGLPPGVYQRNRQGQITEVAPRSFQAQRDQERASQQEAGRYQALENKIESANTAISRAREMVSGWSTGTGAQLGGVFTRQARANLAGQVDTLKAIFSFSELQQMRENSPTGGALGNVSNIELNLLGSTVASLSQEMSPEEFSRSLDIIEGAIQRWQEAVDQWRRDQGQYGSASPPPVRFQTTDAQNRAWSQVSGRGDRGTQNNPIVINPSDPTSSYNNIPRGSYFITPDGEIRGPKP